MRCLLIALLALGCGSTELSVNAEPLLAADTATAVEVWNAALQTECPSVALHFTTDGDADVVIRLGYAFGRGAYHEGDDVPGGDIIVVDPDKPDRKDTLIAHELGHVLIGPGFHSSREADLMHATWDDSRGPEPTAYDVERACAHWR